jgi:hypothetical protein
MMDVRTRPTVYAHARLYVAGIFALADLLGIEPITVLTKHREVATTLFMQCCRDGIQVANSIDIPKVYQRLHTTGDWREEKTS